MAFGVSGMQASFSGEAKGLDETCKGLIRQQSFAALRIRGAC
jgi:hypothetical protein